MQISIFWRFAPLLVFACLSVSSPIPSVSPDDSPSTVLASLGLNSTRPLSTGSSSFTCLILQELFPSNETFLQSSAYYTPLYQIPWSQTSWREPACIVTPSSASDLSKILRILRALKTRFATRSGGHLPVPGFNSVGSEGVLIALQNLNNLAVSADRKTATIGTGNRWGAVYRFVEQYGVNVVGGREPQVGVGGFLLGGGLSVFYNAYGLGMDQIVRYQVVLTDGRIVNATQTQRADLYRALKGGLTNFGIVTEFEVQTIPSNQVYYEIYTYSPENTPALLKAYGEFVADPDTDPASNVGIRVDSRASLAFYGYDGPKNRPAIFNKFYSIPVTSTIFPPTNGSINDVLFRLSQTRRSTSSTYGSSFSHRLTNTSFLAESYEVYRDLVPKLPPGMSLIYAPQGVYPSLVDIANSKNGGNILNLVATPQNWADIFVEFENPENTPQAQSIVNEFVATVSQKARAKGLMLPYIYPNNAGLNQKPLQGYGDRSFNYIKSIAKKYDPTGVMQTLQNDGFLVSKP